RQGFQLLSCGAPSAGFSREFSVELRREVKSIAGRCPGKRILRVAFAQGLLHVVGGQGKQAIGKDRHESLAKFVASCRGGQKFLSGALIKRDGVQLILSYVPPARHHGIGEKGGRQVLPDQGLNRVRDNEILFHNRKNIGQICEGSRQVSAAAGG